MSQTLHQALNTLHHTGRVRLPGAPARWSSAQRVLTRVLIILVSVLLVGGLIAIVYVTVVSDGPVFGMIFGFVTTAAMMIGLIFMLVRGGRKETAYYDVERQHVILEPDGLTLRGIGPIPWVDFGPAIHKMVPAERTDGYIRRAVMPLSPTGLHNVNELTPPEMRERISPAMGPFWNRHHRYIYVPGVEGLKPAEVMHVINTAHQMHSPITPPHPHH